MVVCVCFFCFLLRITVVMLSCVSRVVVAMLLRVVAVLLLLMLVLDFVGIVFGGCVGISGVGVVNDHSSI